MPMKFFQKRAVAAVVLVLAIVAGVAIGQAKKPDTSEEASTAIVGTYTYTYDYAGVLTDDTMEHIDAMNASLFAQTGAQILVVTVDSTDGQDIMDYAVELGNTYGVGSQERNNGVVMVLALDNISQSGLAGDYCVVVGTGLDRYADDFASMQSYYLESDFAAGDYDAGVEKTFDAFIDWFADFYGVTIQEGYIPAVGTTYSNGNYYTVTGGYVAPTVSSLLSGVAAMLVLLLVLWVILEQGGGLNGWGSGRCAVQPLPQAVSGARHGAAHGAVLPGLLGQAAPSALSAPAAQTTQTASSPAASAFGRRLLRELRRWRHVRRRALWRCGRVPRQLRRRRLRRRGRPARRLWRRIFPGRRRPEGRQLPGRTEMREGPPAGRALLLSGPLGARNSENAEIMERNRRGFSSEQLDDAGPDDFDGVRPPHSGGRVAADAARCHPGRAGGLFF